MLAGRFSFLSLGFTTDPSGARGADGVPAEHPIALTTQIAKSKQIAGFKSYSLLIQSG